ncbi:MAG: homoserine dehydrogenase [Eisenbergiella sp.]
MSEKRSVKAALQGLGTVGYGVYKVLRRQSPEMEQKLGTAVELKKILVRNLEKAAKKVEDSSVLTTDWQGILKDPEIEIVIELMGGMEPARTCSLEAMKAGKHVVTANKDLLAADGKELMDTADSHHCDFFFEAAVAGGIPIIRPLKQCLAGNYISEVMGIINGTTNFILTKMTREGMEFADALALAQKLGYAEADPTADIEGLDAGRKVAILASIAFHSRVTFDDVYTEGITKISARDICYAKEMGYDIKLLGVARQTDSGIEARVHPMMIESAHPLASVNDSYNAVFVVGDAVGDTMFYGRGAGEMPTASAVVGDVRPRPESSPQYLRRITHLLRNLPVIAMDETANRYFIRMQVENTCGVLAAVAKVLGDNCVSVAQMIQKNVCGEHAEIVLITDRVKERHFRDSLQTFMEMEVIREISSVIRVQS